MLKQIVDGNAHGKREPMTVEERPGGMELELGNVDAICTQRPKIQVFRVQKHKQADERHAAKEPFRRDEQQDAGDKVELFFVAERPCRP